MIDLTQGTCPLTDFERNTSEFISQIRRTRRPVILTVDGKAEFVVHDAQSYHQILERLDRFELVEAIRVGVAAADEGRVAPARQALAQLQEKLGIPD